MMHPGPHSHDSGFGAGPLHPLTSLDPWMLALLGLALAAALYVAMRLFRKD